MLRRHHQVHYLQIPPLVLVLWLVSVLATAGALVLASLK
jgi:hypothetical protein